MIGQRFCDEMKARTPAIEVETVPAFRFSHLWDNGTLSARGSRGFRILVALSIMKDESVLILDKVITLQQNLGYNEIEFMIKTHPTMPIETLKGCVSEKWPDNFQIVEGSALEPIKASDLLITGASSICFEALFLGVPVILVETLSGLSFDSIPQSVPKELWSTCRTSNEIFTAIHQFKNRSPEEIIYHQENSARIKKEYIEPVTRDGVYRFLELDNSMGKEYV